MMNIKPVSILITDDDPVNRASVNSAIIQLKPHANIQYAKNGIEAIDAVLNEIKYRNKNFDFIIMDFQMPLMNGQLATQKIRQIEAENQVSEINKAIIVTWSAARNSPMEGSDAAITKPLVVAELKNILQMKDS